MPAERTGGGRAAGRAGRLVATLAERLSASSAFGRLPEQDLYTIGQLATHLRVSLRTLRFYEQAGLLKPAREGTKRLYTRQDLDLLTLIVVLREMEVPLPDIEELVGAIEAGPSEAAISARIASLFAGLRLRNEARIGQLRHLNERIVLAGERLRSAS